MAIMARMGKESGLNRLAAQLLQGSTRLAFWRKPDVLVPAQAPANIQDAPSRPAFMARIGRVADWKRWIAPLQQQAARLAFWHKPDAVMPDTAETNQAPSPAQAPASSAPPDAHDDEVFLSLDAPMATPGIDQLFGDDSTPSEFATDKSNAEPGFTEQTDPDTISAAATTAEPVVPAKVPPVVVTPAAAKPATGIQKQSAPSDAPASDNDSDDDSDAAPANRMRRLLAVLSRKKVWIPGVSFVLLAIMGSLLLMLLHAKQEQHRLQTELLAAQQKGKPSPASAHAVAHAPAAMQVAAIAAGADSVPVSTNESGIADSQPGIDPDDCIITDQASVLKNLKRCIDSFNTATAQ